MDIITQRYDYAIPLILSFVLTFNILTLVTLYLRRDRDHLIRVSSMFICNVSISDLLVGFMLLCNTVLYYFHKTTSNVDEKQTLMRIMTHFESLTMRVTLIVAGMTLFILTFIRIMALTRTHFRYRINRQITMYINSIVWVSSALLVGTYNGLFGLYMNQNGYGQYEQIMIPGIIFSAFLVFSVCHMIIWKILRSHDMSMMTYLQTLRHYISTRTLKSISSRNLFTASFGRKNKKKNNTNRNLRHDNEKVSNNSHIIENHYIDETYRCNDNIPTFKQQQQQQQQILQQQVHRQSDKIRCRKQIKFLFGTKDISLLRFEALVYLACWFPLAIIVLLHILDLDLKWYRYEEMEQYVLLLVFMKSVFTPCLYLLYAKYDVLCLNKALKGSEQNTLDSSCSTITSMI